MLHFVAYCGLAFIEATAFGASAVSHCETGQLVAGIALGVLGIAPAANRWAERFFAPAPLQSDE
jgi:hypothetical protein